MVVAAPSQAEAYLLACTSIVRDLIQGVQAEEEINLNQLRLKYGKKYKVKGVPRLVDILSAVPLEWQDRLKGALRAKPVRTASGVSDCLSRSTYTSRARPLTDCYATTDRSCGGHVQTSSMSTCSDDGKYLRVSRPLELVSSGTAGLNSRICPTMTGIAPEVPIRISNTVLRVIPDMRSAMVRKPRGILLAADAITLAAHFNASYSSEIRSLRTSSRTNRSIKRTRSQCRQSGVHVSWTRTDRHL